MRENEGERSRERGKGERERERESACESEMVSDVAESLVWWTAIQRDRKINFLPHYQCPAAIT